jgi:hypothetical protein
MDEPSRAELIQTPSHTEPSRARLVSSPTQCGRATDHGNEVAETDAPSLRWMELGWKSWSPGLLAGFLRLPPAVFGKGSGTLDLADEDTLNVSNTPAK